ncbi:hypothetical protein Nepgr_018731 [Nepenthes gracilis]|uniref:Uncharacterized protein n=1 Tax=Nepenthes gracilis TaxID=150966 RepID=A0AAD3XUJ7_NEPGR|nr:hypothetical protein Nepgr_018731 [Nepenthes gracilis]
MNAGVAGVIEALLISALLPFAGALFLSPCCAAVGSCDARQWLAPLVVFDCYAAGIGMNALVGLISELKYYCFSSTAFITVSKSSAITPDDGQSNLQLHQKTARGSSSTLQQCMADLYGVQLDTGSHSALKLVVFGGSALVKGCGFGASLTGVGMLICSVVPIEGASVFRSSLPIWWCLVLVLV